MIENGKRCQRGFRLKKKKKNGRENKELLRQLVKRNKDEKERSQFKEGKSSA